MVISSQMPATGQFVAVWHHDGKLYSETLKWYGQRLLRFRSYDDLWESEDFPGYYELADAKFVTEH